MGFRLILLLTACSLTLTAQKIASGYAEDFPIGDLKTFAFMAQERQKPDELAEDVESAEFIKNQLIAALTAAGYTLTVENPDFVIAYYAKTYLRSTYRHLGYKTLDSEMAVSQDNYDTGVLIVDFISLQRKQAVWRGRADKTISQKNVPKVITKVCQKLVQQFEKDIKAQAKRRKR
jgi:uncharacterized protein DUF4136